MSVSEILFVVAGALLGLAFQGGMFLFLIPFAVVAFSLACMNRPSLPNGTTVLPVIKRDKRSTALTPVVSPEIRNEFANNVKMETNEPNSSLRVNEIWSRANSDVDKAFGAGKKVIVIFFDKGSIFEKYLTRYPKTYNKSS